MSQQLSPSVCAQRLRVLADPNRLAVLTILLEGPQHVWELNERLGLEQSLLSHHLQVLRKQGFVKAQRDGKAVLYSLATSVRDSSGTALNLGCCVLSFEPNSSEPASGPDYSTSL